MLGDSKRIEIAIIVIGSSGIILISIYKCINTTEVHGIVHKTNGRVHPEILIRMCDNVFLLCNEAIPTVGLVRFNVEIVDQNGGGNMGGETTANAPLVTEFDACVDQIYEFYGIELDLIGWVAHSTILGKRHM